VNCARALLTGLIDYAGLFPPAQLLMRAAVPKYAMHRSGPFAWLAGRFVLPLTQLDEFERVFDALPPGDRSRSWSLVVLGGRNHDADLRKITEFNRRHGEEGRQDARIDGLDLKVHSLDDIGRAADVMTEPAELYFEVPTSTDPREWVAAIRSAGGRAKIRTGGVNPEMFPPVPDVARFLQACAGERVPFKATAGLHHAIRSAQSLVPEREPTVVMHGFLNLFVAAALVCCDRLSTSALEGVLTEESPEAFAFDATDVKVHGRCVSCNDMAAARRSFALSFGSCSFDQPLEELRSLSLL
jgi:hypothetical protein